MDETTTTVETTASPAPDFVEAGYDHLAGKFYIRQGGTTILLDDNQANHVVACLELAIEDLEDEDADDEFDEFDDDDDLDDEDDWDDEEDLGDDEDE